jgi:tetratricopeptide (TPR) repeat protein
MVKKTRKAKTRPAPRARTQAQAQADLPGDLLVQRGTVPLPAAPPRQEAPQGEITLDQAMTLAVQHEEAGRLQPAADLLERILRVRPQHAPALHLLGVVLHLAGRTEQGAELVRRAIAIDGGVALYHANRAEMCRLLKRLDDAVEHGRRAVALDPKMVAGHSNLGIAYFDQGELDEAEACQKRALKLNPAFGASLNNMGSILVKRREDEAALDWYQKAIDHRPDYLEPMNNLAAALTRLDRPTEAIAWFDRALAGNPRYPEALCNKGFALALLERWNEALACFDQALQARPEYPEAYIGVARICHESRELENAERAARRAIEIKPDHADAWCALGGILVTQGRAREGKAAFERSLELDDESIGAKQGIGGIYVEEGKLAEAEKIFSGLLPDTKDKVSVLFSLVQSRKTRPGDEAIALFEEEAKKLEQLPSSKALVIHFGLGKIYDDLGDFNRAFPHFIAGCRMKWNRLQFDSQERDREFSRTREIFTKDFVKKHAGQGFDSDTPIFVLGMPRSGTTLTEQIIASHPDVFGAGELFDLQDIAAGQGWAPQGSPGFPENMARIRPEAFGDIGRGYVEAVRAQKPEAKRITDKMPSNFMKLGLIHLALPGARIVHVRRHPLDTCISCYTRLFAYNQDFTYDLYELGRQYRNYVKLMEHWRAVLPKNAFYDIQYEELIADTKGQTKKLLAYCGLEWDKRCLDFHKNERSIRTASVTQVRQPIYKTSVARWKKYEKFLGPLIEGLGDVLQKVDTL